MGYRYGAKHIKSKYKHVSGQDLNGSTYWIFIIKGQTRQSHKTEKEAAIAADKYLIQQGKEPVNILIKK